MCNAKADSLEAIEFLSSEAVEALTVEMLPNFITEIEALPEGAIPAGCAADLIAVAEAIIGQ
jgi:hypothetical protein